MYKSFVRACLVITILIFPHAVHAAGLGKLTLNSALGQPLKAEIDLVAVKEEDASSLTAMLASQEAFRQAGISYKSLFSSLAISIEPRANGDSYIKITSPNAINEPFLNMLVELSWASGRLMREYTVLLDPVESATPEPVAPVIRDVPVVVETYSDEPEEIASPVIEQVDAEPAIASESTAGDTYGPVKPGDTLSKIVRQVFPDSVNLNQMMIALFRANQGAFISSNINLLKVDEILRLPSLHEIAEISELEANAEVKVHVADWRNYKNELAVAVNETSSAEVLKQVDTGEITTAMQDEVVASETPDEVLTLSSGVHIDDTLGLADDAMGSPQERMQMIEEDSIARSLALIEANERIETLEQNIQNLQQLLELKNPALAQAQIQAEELLEEESVADFVPDALDDILPMLDAVIDITEQEIDEFFLSDEELNESIAALEADADAAAEAKITTEALIETPAEAVEEASIMQQVMDNIAYIGGLIAFMLISALIAMKIRRNKSENDGELDFDAPTSQGSMASVTTAGAAVGSLAAQEEAEAANVDGDALATEVGSETETPTEADVHTDVIDADQKDSEEINLDFSQDERVEAGVAEENSESVADPLVESDEMSQQSQEPESDIDLDLDNLVDETKNEAGQDELAADVAVDDSNSDNMNAFAEDKQSDNAEVDEEPEFTDHAIASLKEAIRGESEATAAENKEETETAEEGSVADDTGKSANEIEYEPNLDAVDRVDSKESAEDTARAETENTIAFDVDAPTETSEADENTLPDLATTDATEALGNEEKLDSSIDSSSEAATPELDAAAEAKTEADASVATPDAAVEDATPESAAAPDAEASVEDGEQDAHWHDVETKIDLAKAYIEMDDKEGAKEILDEVVKEGDVGQQEKAKELLGGLS